MLAQVKAEAICNHLTSNVSEHYDSLLSSSQLRPYVGHSIEWDLVEGVRMCETLQVCGAGIRGLIEMMGALHRAGPCGGCGAHV